MRRPVSAPVYLQVLAWVLLFPLLYFGVRGVFSFDRGQYVNNAGVDLANVAVSSSDTVLYRVERFGVYGTILVVMGFSLFGTMQVAKRNLAILALPALAIVSTLWSQDRIKTLSLGILVSCLTAFSIYLGHRFKGRSLIDLMNMVGGAATLSSYFLIAFDPGVAIRNVDGSRAWQGLFAHKNYLGSTMVLFLTAAFYTESRTALTRFLKASYMVAMVVLVGMSQSRTAWIELFLLACYILFERIYTRAGKMERVVVWGSVVVTVVAVTIIVVNFGGDIAVALGKTSDMTGRTGIFEVIWPELWKRPLIGFGYQAFWLGLKGESANIQLTPGHATVANAENGLLQMWLELGAIGTAAMVFLLLRAFRNARICLTRKPSKFIRWNCAIVFLSLIGSVSGAKFMYPDSLEWVLFVLVYVNLAEEIQRLRVQVPEKARLLAWAS